MDTRQVEVYNIRCMDCNSTSFEVVWLIEKQELCICCKECDMLWSVSTLASIKIVLNGDTGYLTIDKTSFN